METTIDLTSLSEWNQFAEERKTVLETMTILNNRHRAIVTELNQRLIERTESFQTQLVRIEDGWRERLREAQAQIVALRDAYQNFRDIVLNERGLLSETIEVPVNAILSELDHAFAAAISTPAPPVVPLEDVRPLVDAMSVYIQNGDMPGIAEHAEKALSTFTVKYPELTSQRQ